ncbi:VPGUxxT family thioredoxin-like (seleno)protein, type 2 [Sphingomonas sp. PR090111-T3T-6A]|uniref:VPGUxxT family thioredoxin-like (seleno)protein, type 2 n=1 Tax=Sphingomonas sp. PR090111-T3T-6A TaxID=685778 RepID=UPI00039EDA82|nr:VPGUxxT family thioredoxin-like (seleno)protein, type 2 [Sphingomonas sp. PR090111-T3T-6A]
MGWKIPPTGQSDMHETRISFREHAELGDVAWLRDHDGGLALAAQRDKPVLLLFQEVPGCSTCVRFGQDVLTHPLMVELIADRFVPVAIFNNHRGADAEILHRYGEASWNNPVVRFLAPDGAELLPKLADRYDALGLHEKIGAVLEARGEEVPGYFRLLGRDLLVDYGVSRSATYATPCFWSGETSLAQHQAIITTDPGFIAGEEAVRVQYDPRAVSRADLDAYALAEGFEPIDGPGFALDDEPQFYLRKSLGRFLPLTPAQRTQLNLAVPYRSSLADLLSPQQTAWLADPRLAQAGTEDLYRADIRKSWPDLAARLGIIGKEG